MKKVFLLGAGSMLCMGGPSTKTLNDLAKGVVCKHGYSDIITALDSTFGNTEYNFETIIASIEYLLDWAIGNNVTGTIDDKNLISIIFSPIYDITNKVESLKDCYLELINSIVDIIKDYSFFNKENNNHKLLKTFIRNQLSISSLKIYSLNYDHLITDMFPDHVFDGTSNVSHNSLVDRKFNYDLCKFVNSNFTHFNIHGSIYLKQEPSLSYEVVQSPFCQHINYILFQKGGLPNDRKVFSPIIAGYSKSQRLMGNPFNFGLTSFAEDCNSCDELVIVGYSFSDPQINSIVKYFANKHGRLITIVDFDKNSDTKRIEDVLAYRLNCISEFKEHNAGSYSKDDNIQIYAKGFVQYLKNSINNDTH